MRLVLATGVAAFWLVACAHTVTNEERLDGMTDVTVDTVDEADGKLRCRDGSPEVSIARDRSQKKAERMARYDWAIAEAKSMHGRFDDAFKNEPDLIYGPKAEEWKRRQAFCLELAATLKKERDRLEGEAGEPVVAEKPAPKPAPAPAPAEEKPAKAEKAETASASAADEAFEDDADELRSTYKKKAKTAKSKSKKSKSKKKKAELAHR